MTIWDTVEENEWEPTDVRPVRSAVDGLLVGQRDVWVLISRADEDPVGMLFEDEEPDEEIPFVVCRGIRDDGTVLLGRPDPDQDALISQIMRRGTDEQS
jgi:hypothetical protein